MARAATTTDAFHLIRAGFKGGQTGQLPRASTTIGGASTKTVKKLLPKET